MFCGDGEVDEYELSKSLRNRKWGGSILSAAVHLQAA